MQTWNVINIIIIRKLLILNNTPFLVTVITGWVILSELYLFYCLAVKAGSVVMHHARVCVCVFVCMPALTHLSLTVQCE